MFVSIALISFIVVCLSKVKLLTFCCFLGVLIPSSSSSITSTGGSKKNCCEVGEASDGGDKSEVGETI